MAQYNKICVVDSTPFTATRRDAKFCSDTCKKKYRRGATPNDNLVEPPAKLVVGVDMADTPSFSSAVVKHRAVGISTLPSMSGFRGGKVPSQKSNSPEFEGIKAVGDGKGVVAHIKKKNVAEAEPQKELQSTRSDLRARMNARLRAKGLPLIMEKPEVLRFVATGIAELDGLTAEMDVAGIGGLPRKHITEIYGPKGAGKSSLVKSIYKSNPDLNILFFDAEGGLTAPPEGIDIVKGNVVEDIMTTMVEMVQAQAYDLIILDSVASLVTKKAFDDDPEGKAAMARSFGPMVKRLVAHMQPLGDDGYPSDASGTAIVFINQFRSTTQSFGQMEYTVGGKALEYYASLRLEMRSAKKDYIIRDGKLAGQQVRVKVEKTRFGVKDKEIRYPIMFSELQDFDEFYVKRLKEMGLR